MNVLALVPHPAAGASTRYRIHQFVPELARLGVTVTVQSLHDAASFARLYRPGEAPAKLLDLWRAWRRRGAQVDDAGKYDAVWVHRELWPLYGLGLERALVAKNPRLAFDLDDAIWLPNVSAANRAFAFAKDPAKTAWWVAHARAVSAGNHLLEAWSAERMPSTSRAFHVPTAVDPDRWRPASATSDRRGGDVVLGWIGSHTTVPYLDLLAPALARLATLHPGLTLRVIGGRYAHPSLRVECVPWSEDTEVAALDGVDIGISPLPDDAWARGKCGLKALQAMSLAKPVVASRVGAHLDLVRDGETGFLPADDDAWVERLGALIADPQLRARIGAAARERVRTTYSLTAVAPAVRATLAWAAGVR